MLLPHDTESLAGAQKGAGEIGVDDQPPLFEGEFVDWSRGAERPGVVEEKVDAAELLACTLEEMRTKSSRVTSVGTTRPWDP